MKKILILCIVLSMTVCGYSSGFSSLKLGADARSGGLGMAYTALSNDGSGGFWNPAGLVTAPRHDMVLSIYRWIQGTRTEFLGFGSGNGRNGFGIYIFHTQVTDLEYRLDVPTNDPLGTFSDHEMVLGLSWAREIRKNIMLGITLKGLYQKIFTDEATGLAVDIGALWQVWDDGLRIGAVVQNIGRTSKLQEMSIKLPLMWKAGLAYPVKAAGGIWTFTADGLKERDFPFRFHSGMEYLWGGMIAGRIGYQAGYAVDGIKTRDITAGLGILWSGYRLDYSYMPFYSDLGDVHRLSLSFQW